MRKIPFIVAVLASASLSSAATQKQQLDSAIATSTATVASIKAKVTSLSTHQAALIAKLQATNALSSPLVVGGIQTIRAGTSTILPVTFVPISTMPIASLQVDILVPTGFSITSAKEGPAAVAAGKTASFSGNRVILFGLNQTAIGSGVILNIGLTAGTNVGLAPIVLSNPVASDISGNGVMLSGTSGTIKVTP